MLLLAASNKQQACGADHRIGHKNLSHGDLGDRKGLPVYEKVKRMNASDLRDQTPDQLRDELANLKKEAFNLRFQQATGQLENTARMRAVKRDTARVKTVLNEKAASAAQ